MKIQIKDVSFSYANSEVLSGVSLEYDTKDFLSIIGANGSGKSTLLKLMIGLLEPSSGEILIGGKNPKKADTSYVPQNIPVNAAFPISVLEVVLMGRIDKKIFGFYSKNDKKEALKALNLVGMEEFANRRISELSGGQRQRVYIARALQAKAKVLMLDEPTASIDARGQAEIYSILSQINKQGTGIIMVSHDINMALNFSNLVAYVDKKIFLHDVGGFRDNKAFINHLSYNHEHFCDVELALKKCGCNTKWRTL